MFRLTTPSPVLPLLAYHPECSSSATTPSPLVLLRCFRPHALRLLSVLQLPTATDSPITLTSNAITCVPNPAIPPTPLSFTPVSLTLSSCHFSLPPNTLPGSNNSPPSTPSLLSDLLLRRSNDAYSRTLASFHILTLAFLPPRLYPPLRTQYSPPNTAPYTFLRYPAGVLVSASVSGLARSPVCAVSGPILSTPPYQLSCTHTLHVLTEPGGVLTQTATLELTLSFSPVRWDVARCLTPGPASGTSTRYDLDHSGLPATFVTPPDPPPPFTLSC
uniref:Uncharacterized protein n=1 Tax=Knipowitschia caucasica TaxID=637954 RepID=A0AAV2KKH5_KNICA